MESMPFIHGKNFGIEQDSLYITETHSDIIISIH